MNSQVLNQSSVLCHLLPPYDKYVVYYVQNNRPTTSGCCLCACVCVWDTWSMCTIQVHSFWCYYYTSETLAKRVPRHNHGRRTATSAAARRVRAGLEVGVAKGKNGRREKKSTSGWGPGLRTARQWNKLRPKRVTIVQSGCLPKADLANQSLILRSSLDSATFFLSSEYPASHYWHGLMFLHNLYHKRLYLLFAVYHSNSYRKRKFLVEKKTFAWLICFIRCFKLRTLWVSIMVSWSVVLRQSGSTHIWCLSLCSSFKLNKASVRGR